MVDPLRAAVQAILDATGDGWTLAHHVTAMGLERMTADGDIESAFWLYHPQGQADYITVGLLDQAVSLDCAEVDEDTD